MEPRPDPNTVTCIGCREPYVPAPTDLDGCPRCGCLSWVAARLAAPPQGPATPPAAPSPR